MGEDEKKREENERGSNKNQDAQSEHPTDQSTKEKTSSKKKECKDKLAEKTSSSSTDSNTSKEESITKDDLEDLEEDLQPITGLDENLQKLISPEEREQMEENLDLVVCYLQDIGIADMSVDREKLIITVPFDYEDFTFLSHIVLSPEWILIKTSIFELDTVSEVAIFNLFAEILKGNFILNSVVYALDPENKSIWAQADVPITADFETFKLSYFSIVFAIDYFMKNISTKVNLQLKSTLDREQFESNPENLYI